MRCMMLMIPGGYGTAAPDTMPETDAVARMMKYNEELRKAGILLSLDGLHPPATGARVTFSGGRPTVRRAPYPGVTETLGGYWILDVKSVDEAIEWATKCPAGDHETVEVRRIHEMADFPEEIQKAAAEFEGMRATGAEA